jgi:hypothetical protein
MLHSLRGAFRLGDADAKTYMAALKAAATTGTWETAGQVRKFLHELRGDLLPPSDLPRFEQTVRTWFAPRLATIGLERKRREPPATALLRAELAEALVKVARDPITLTTLAAKGAQHLQALSQSQTPPALAAELVPASLWAAVATGGEPIARTAIAAIEASTEAETRNQIIVALAAARDPAANKAIEDFVAAGSLRVREQGTYMRTAFADGDRRPGAWAWLRRDFKRIAGGIPRDARSRLVGLASNLCADRSRAEIEWFYKPMIANISGAPRVYANALEAVDRCVSWRKSKGAGLAAAL